MEIVAVLCFLCYLSCHSLVKTEIREHAMRTAWTYDGASTELAGMDWPSSTTASQTPPPSSSSAAPITAATAISTTELAGGDVPQTSKTVATTAVLTTASAIDAGGEPSTSAPTTSESGTKSTTTATVSKTTTLTPAPSTRKATTASQQPPTGTPSTTTTTTRPTTQTTPPPPTTTTTPPTTTTTTTTTLATTTLPQRFCNESVKLVYNTRCYPCDGLSELNCDRGDKTLKEEFCAEVGQCMKLCMHSSPPTKCCRGFWGKDCLNECPGGWDHPCYGNGDCQADGSCICKPGFAGQHCEWCEAPGKYGVGCAQVCACTQGHCLQYATERDSYCECDSGYRGATCSNAITKCKDLTCNAAQKCMLDDTAESNPECEDLTEVCKANYPNCGLPGTNSSCQTHDDGRYRCGCNEGYSGASPDYCHPIDPCEADKDPCSSNTTCKTVGPGKHKCECKSGYEPAPSGNGCVLTDICKPTTCQKNAICETFQVGRTKCTCMAGYTSMNGMCTGDILQTLKDLNSKGRFKKQLEEVIHLLETFYKGPITKPGPFTIFVPIDKAFKTFRRDGGSPSLDDSDRATQALRMHMLLGRHTLKKLKKYDRFYTLQGNSAMMQVNNKRGVAKFRIEGNRDKAKVMKGDVLATNGVVHIVNSLLAVKPEIRGSTDTDALSYFAFPTGPFRKMKELIEAAKVEDTFTKENITVFAVSDAVLSNIPSQTYKYLTQNKKGKIRLKEILLRHVLPSRRGVTDIISLDRMKAVGNYRISVKIQMLGAIRLDNRATIKQANIPVTNGLVHFVDGFFYNLASIYDNFCNTYRQKETQTRCVENCASQSCPATYALVREKICGRYGWRRKRSIYPVHNPIRIPDDPYGDLYGGGFGRYPYHYTRRRPSGDKCQKVCSKKEKVTACCKNFYGRDCRPCPGDIDDTCSGNGKCSDGIRGNGRCMCNAGYTGTACERCSNSRVFGPNCDQPCTCTEFGLCDAGTAGTGKCLPGSCRRGTTGENCELKEIRCDNRFQFCHANSHCVRGAFGEERCECDTGYRGDGKNCVERDPCKDVENGDCHEQATCTKLSPLRKMCTCNTGWTGDGFFCSPELHCYNMDSYCHPNASCILTEPFEYHCVCDAGFKGDGKNCTVDNDCLTDNGGCHPKAICTPVRPERRTDPRVKCECPFPAIGNGSVCYATIAEQIMVNPNLTALASHMEIVDWENLILADETQNLTFFAPSNDAMDSFWNIIMETGRAHGKGTQLSNVDFLNFHTLDRIYPMDALLAFAGLTTYPTLYDGFSLFTLNVNQTLNIIVKHQRYAQVLLSDIQTTNGIYHIIDLVLEPFYPNENPPTLESELQASTRFSKFYQALNESGVLAEVLQMDKYTIFVPDNRAFGEVTRNLSAQALRYYVVPQLLFSASVYDGQEVDALTGPGHKLLMNIKGQRMSVNSVRVSRADTLVDGGVIHEIKQLLHPVLNWCNMTQEELVQGECMSCRQDASNFTCPPSASPFFPPRVLHDNCILDSQEPDAPPVLGCYQLCARVAEEDTKCCAGFYGLSCQECPGGAETPCNDHGKCFDTETGNGTCDCDPGFTGFDCSACADPSMARPDCSTTHSSCDNGNHTKCHENAVCYAYASEDKKCICKAGHHGDGVTSCDANVDPCKTDNHGGCDKERATCSYLTPKVTDWEDGKPICECNREYTGDGILCSKGIWDAISRIPDVAYFRQMALQDTATWLDQENLSSLLGDVKQNLTLFAPAGENYPTLDIRDLILVNDILWLPADHQRPMMSSDVGPMPPLPPQDGDSNSGGGGGSSGGNTIRPDHMLHIPLRALSGFEINITADVTGQLFANGVPVRRKNIETFNGVVHITEHPLNLKGTVTTGASQASQSSVLTISIIVVVVVVVVAAAVVVAVLVIRSRGGLAMFKSGTARQNSESNVSFAKLSAQEEEEDSPTSPKYDNPIFADPDLL